MRCFKQLPLKNNQWRKTIVRCSKRQNSFNRILTNGEKLLSDVARDKILSIDYLLDFHDEMYFALVLTVKYLPIG